MNGMLPRLTLWLCLCAAARAQSGVTGTWKADEVAFAPWTFVLKTDGGKLTGTVRQGDGGGTTTLTDATEINSGVVEGNKLSFQVESPDRDRTITFKGVLEGDVITFDRSVEVHPGAFPGMNGIYGAAGATHFAAKRVTGASAATEPLRLVLLGTGTPNIDPDRSGPAVVVVAGPQAYLVDAGPGVVRRARTAVERTGIVALRPTLLTYLFLTHLHSDHTLGYPDLIFTPAVVGRGKALETYGPKGTKEMTDHLMAAWKKDMDVRLNGLEHGNANAYHVNVHEIKPGVVHKDDNVTVRAFLVKHATWDEAFGYRFETPGRSIVISGDTSPSPSIPEACSGCDVLVHEVYCDPPSGQPSPYYRIAHTSATELAQIATQAKPKLLVLYHQLFTGGCSEAALVQQVQRGFSGKVVSGRDFDVF